MSLEERQDPARGNLESLRSMIEGLESRSKIPGRESPAGEDPIILGLRKSLGDLERLVADRTAGFTGANERLQAEVAERRRAEEDARTGEARIQAVLGAIPDMIFRVRRDGTFLDFKPAAHLPLYRPPEEFLGRRIGDVMPSDVAAGFHEAMERAFAGKTVGAHEYRLQFGEEIGFFESRIVVFAEDEVLAIVRDVSERERTEERERRHRDELAHVARVSSLGEMALALAHELSQPLAAISASTGGCLRILRTSRESPPDVLEALVKVAAQADRAGQVLRGLRRFISREEPVRTPIDLNALVHDTHHLCEGDLRAQAVRVCFQLAEGLPPVRADAIQIQQIILNLMRNAAESMAGSPAEEREMVVGTSRSGREVEVSIEDRGSGIRPEIGEHLFEPFRTTKPGGMGMGLAIGRRLAEAHGGRLSMRKNPDRGMTFFLILPLLDHGAGTNDVDGADGFSRR